MLQSYAICFSFKYDFSCIFTLFVHIKKVVLHIVILILPYCPTLYHTVPARQPGPRALGIT